MTKDEALRLALEALEDACGNRCNAEYNPCFQREAINAIEAALEANEFNPDWDTQAVLVEEIQRMAKRIEELEAKNEPAAWMYPDDLKRFETSETCAEAYSIEMVSPTQGETVPLYTTPPQRTWVGLTDEEFDQAWRRLDYTVSWAQHRIDIARTIEAKLKEKNT